MSASVARDHRTVARVLAEVAARPTVDVETMQKVIRQVVWALVDEDPLTFNPVWFCDLIITHLTELQTRQATLPARPDGVSPHTRVITLDDDAKARQVANPNPPRWSAAVRSLQNLKANISKAAPLLASTESSYAAGPELEPTADIHRLNRHQADETFHVYAAAAVSRKKED